MAPIYELQKDISMYSLRHSIRVLLVDDELTLANAVARVLERESDNIAVEIAVDAGGGLERLATGEFDCIISGYEMSGQNGIEFLRTVRERFEEIPFILVSGKMNDDVASEALSAGATECIRKRNGTPEPTVLVNRIETVVERYHAQRELKRSQERLSWFMDQSPLGIIEWNSNPEIVNKNGTGEETLGYSIAEDKGRNWAFLLPGDGSEQPFEGVDDVLETDYGISRNVTKDDVAITREWHNRVVPDENADPIGAISKFQNITEHEQTQQELKAVEQFLQCSLDALQDIFFILDTNGELIRVNKRGPDVTGYAESELLGKTAHEFFVAEDRQRVADYVEKAVETGSSQLEARLRTKSGETILYEFRARELTDCAGDVIGVVVTGRDISERKQREAERKQTIQRVTDAIVKVDENWQFTLVDDRAAEIYGMTEDELRGQDFWEVFSEAVGTQFEDVYRGVMQSREPDAFEAYYGGVLNDWFEINVYPDDDGGVSFYFREITERKERERELEQYEAMVETVEDGVFVLDADLRFHRVNEEIAEMVGCSKEELLGEHVSVVMAEKSAAETDAIDEGLFADDSTSGRVELELETKAGDTFPVETRAAEFDLEDETVGRVGVTRDVSTRKRLERELRQNERRYRTLVEMSPDPILVHSDGEIVYANTAFVDQVGAESVAAVQETQITEYLDPAEQENALATARQTQQGELAPSSYQRVMRTLNGGRRYITTTSHSITFQGERSVLTIIKDQTELQQHHQAVETLHEHTREMLQCDDVASVAESAVAAVPELFELPGATVFEYDGSRNALVPVAESARLQNLFGDAPTITPEDGDEVWKTFVEGEAKHVTAPEETSGVPDELPITSGLYIPLGNYGIFATASVDESPIAETTVELCSILAANLEAALDRVYRDQTLKEREERLQHQKVALEELDHLNTIIRDINQSILEAHTQESVETEVCQKLAAKDAYSSVWIGREDDAGQVSPVTMGGSETGLIDQIRNAGADTPIQSFVREAVRSGESQHVEQVLDDTAWADERQMALMYGFRSLVAVPIPLGSDMDRVLVIHAAESDAFTDQQLQVFGELGQMIGKAMHAQGSSHPQVAGTTTEIELEIDDERLFLNRATELVSTELTLNGAVPTNDGQVLGFLEASLQPNEARVLVDHLYQIESLECLANGEGSSLFKFEGPMVPFLEILYEYDARLTAMTSRDGRTTATLELSADISVRDLVNVIAADYPDTELIAKRCREESVETPLTFQETVKQSCTDRQYQALQTAYHGGFYEWPRSTSNEELAEILDISSPTYQSHRRAAEQVMVSQLFGQ